MNTKTKLFFFLKQWNVKTEYVRHCASPKSDTNQINFHQRSRKRFVEKIKHADKLMNNFNQLSVYISPSDQLAYNKETKKPS